MTDFSFATSCIDEPTSARYAVEFAIKHGFNGVEFNAPEIYLSKQSEADLDWISDTGNEHDLRYTHHFPPSALPGSHDEATRMRDLEEMKAEIQAASEIGVEVIVVHPGRLHVPGPPETQQEDVGEADRAIAMSHFVEWSKSAAVAAEEAGVVIGLENMHYNPGWLIRSHAELAEAVDAIASPAVGITFDVGHAWGSGGIDAGQEIFGDRIAHVQVHDARGPEGAGNVRDQHMEIGAGLLDFERIGDLVKSQGFVCALETTGRDPAREAICIRSRDLLQRQWG